MTGHEKKTAPDAQLDLDLIDDRMTVAGAEDDDGGASG